jgi:rhodanese-related sulfurtransferase
LEASAPQTHRPSPSPSRPPADCRCCGSGPGLITRAIVIAAVAIAAGAAHSWIVPVKLRLAPRPGVTDATPANPDDGGPDQTPAPASDQFISLEQAHALFESGALFLDTRPRAQFDEARILGAYHLSTEQFGTPEGTEVLSMLSADTPYVLYCDGGDCEASEDVALRLEDAYPLYHIMRDGFPAWRDAGYDIETGAPE